MHSFARTVLAGAVALSALAGAALAADNPMVGGAAMFADKNIVENAVNSKDHTTLVAAVKAAGLVDTLLKPENKDKLTKVLTCHVVAAGAMSSDIGKMIKDDGGTHDVKTVGGCVLKAKMDGDKITLTDETGGVAHVTIADVKQSNGVIHVIDKVLLPKM